MKHVKLYEQYNPLQDRSFELREIVNNNYRDILADFPVNFSHAGSQGNKLYFVFKYQNFKYLINTTEDYRDTTLNISANEDGNDVTLKNLNFNTFRECLLWIKNRYDLSRSKESMRRIGYNVDDFDEVFDRK
jgi:hypothetical protein